MKTHYHDEPTRSVIDLSRPGDMFPGWTIHRVSVLSRWRGNGIASRLLDEVCADADEEQAELWLGVSSDLSDDGLSDDELTKFYGRRGFETVREDCIMRRLPQGLPVA